MKKGRKEYLRRGLLEVMGQMDIGAGKEEQEEIYDGRVNRVRCMEAERSNRGLLLTKRG